MITREDGRPYSEWESRFVAAELEEAAQRLRNHGWIVRRPEVIDAQVCANWKGDLVEPPFILAAAFDFKVGDRLLCLTKTYDRAALHYADHVLGRSIVARAADAIVDEYHPVVAKLIGDKIGPMRERAKL